MMCAYCGAEGSWTLTQPQPAGHTLEFGSCGRHINRMLHSLLRGLVDKPVEVTRVRPPAGASL